MAPELPRPGHIVLIPGRRLTRACRRRDTGGASSPRAAPLDRRGLGARVHWGRAAPVGRTAMSCRF
eukprot:4176283-Heterocapsa_arctica.AAC.1